MQGLIETIIELFTAASASTLSAVESDALLNVVRLFLYGLAALAVAWILGSLEESLPQPLSHPGILAAWFRRLLRWTASASVFSAFFLSWGLSRAEEAMEQTLSRFEQNLTGRSETGWQRETFSAAAQRIAQLGPDYASATEEARRGGLHLPIQDGAAASVLYAVASERTLEQWSDETRWGYRLWRGLVQHTKTPAIPNPKELIEAPMIIGSDPAASPLLRSAIADAVGEIRSGLRDRVSTYVGINRFLLWLPAAVMMPLAFFALCFTASRRCEARFRALRTLP
jgi:hypothetical protein